VREHRGLDGGEHSATIDTVMAGDSRVLPHSLTPTQRHCRPSQSGDRTWTDQPWRERPQPGAQGYARARSAGSLTPGLVHYRNYKPGWWAAQSAARRDATRRAILRARRSCSFSRGRSSFGWTRRERAHASLWLRTTFKGQVVPKDVLDRYVRLDASCGVSTDRIRQRRRGTTDGSTGG